MKKFRNTVWNKAIVCLLIGCLSFLTGCKPLKTKVTYTVYPVGFLIERLARDTITMESIQEDGIVQRAQIKKDYKEILEDAAVLFHIGQLEPYLTTHSKDITAAVDSDVDLSTMNAVYDFQRYTPVIVGEEVTYVETPYYRGDVFQTIDVNEEDLYLWIDPIAMLSMSKDIVSWLKNTYPDNAAIYDENLTRLETDLINLDAQYQALATSNILNNKALRFVSMTASFGNWQKTYGFEVYPVILSKYGVLPNEQQLEIIKAQIVEDGVKYIVYEPNMTEDMIALFNQLQEELNLTRVELSNLSSLTKEEDEAGMDYLSVMYENLKVLETMTVDRNVAVSEETTTQP